MKQKKENKLRLGKETVQDLNITLDREEQKWIKGGDTLNCNEGTTQIPVYC